MLKLLLLRGSPLMLRPAAVVLEGVVIAEGHILVLAIPIAMMAVVISSVPVHLKYFKSLSTDSEYGRFALEYVSGLTWVCLIGLVILVPLLLVLPTKLAGGMVAAVGAFFLIEKLATETSRDFEFKKAYGAWFAVQCVRSGWMFAPITLSVMGIPYEKAFIAATAFTLTIMCFIFHRTIALSPRFSRMGLRAIIETISFLPGNFLPAFYQQMPRILVAEIYPIQAHIFLALTQLLQGVGLIFNVRYQIPYRKIIARKPRVFQRRLKPLMLKMLSASGFIAVVYLVLPYFVDVGGLTAMELGFVLLPILTANALTFSILGAYLGYIQWFVRGTHAMAFYLTCILIFTIPSVIWGSKIDNISLFGIPAIVMLFAFVWLAILEISFFPKGLRDGGNT